MVRALLIGVTHLAHDTDAMVRAHKAGREYATRLDATREGANVIAAGLSVSEGDAFLGGYYGELRRARDHAFQHGPLMRAKFDR